MKLHKVNGGDDWILSIGGVHIFFDMVGDLIDVSTGTDLFRNDRLVASLYHEDEKEFKKLWEAK